MQQILVRLKNLQAPGYPYPHLVVVKEIDDGANVHGKRSLLGKLRNVAMKDMTLHFLCPFDLSEVPCGVDGQGYRFRETRGWVKKLSPVLQVIHTFFFCATVRLQTYTLVKRSLCCFSLF